jgi:hypothetical protein
LSCPIVALNVKVHVSSMLTQRSAVRLALTLTLTFIALV